MFLCERPGVLEEILLGLLSSFHPLAPFFPPHSTQPVTLEVFGACQVSRLHRWPAPFGYLEDEPSGQQK